MVVNKTKLIILLDLADKLITAAQMPLYAVKHSRHDFTNHQLFKLIIIKTYLRQDYRRFCENLETSIIPEYLGLKRIPHFTTLQKFAQRQDVQKLEKMLSNFVELTPKKPRDTGFDGTGFSLHNASKHYEKRLGKTIKKKDFLKSNIFFDLTNLLVLNVKMRKKNRNDIFDMHTMWPKIKKLPFKNVYADKAYDADWFHKLIFEEGKVSKIHLKNENLPLHRTSGIYRKKMKRMGLKNKKKGKRSLCETIISVIKRVYGNFLAARNTTMKKIELLFMLITYNIERIYKITKNILLLFLFFFDFLSFLKKSCALKDVRA